MTVMTNKKKISINDLKANDFPPQVRPFFSKSPTRARMMIVTAVLVCWMANATRLRVKYWYDMGRSMLSVNLLCIGASGSGKSLIRWVVNMLMAPLKLRDREERRREQEYRDLSRKKSKTKDLPDEPLTVVRYLQSITVPKLVKRADFMVRRYGDPLSFFVFTDEIASMVKGSKQQREEYNAVARSAYMEGEEYIRETLYQDGYNASVDINWCSIMCGQDYALDQYIDKAGILQGDANRHILFCLDSFGDEAMIIKPFTEEEQHLIDSTTRSLMDATYTADDRLGPIHMVDMSWLDADVRSWCKMQTEEVTKNGSKAQESFYKRSSASAFRLSTMLYFLWGETPESQKSVRRCYHAYANYILDSLMAKWGRKYEQSLPQPDDTEQKPLPLFDQLPKRFTRDQLRELIVKLELRSPARTFISKWLSKRFIYCVNESEELFEKLY